MNKSLRNLSFLAIFLMAFALVIPTNVHASSDPSWYDSSPTSHNIVTLTVNNPTKRTATTYSVPIPNEAETGTLITITYRSYVVEAGVVITADYTYYALAVEDMNLAGDKVYGSGWENTYASLNYSQTDGYFAVGNCSQPDETGSTIQEVELGIRFSAAASGSGDLYRIVYYVGTPNSPGTKIVLVDWTSDAASLETLVWNNVVDPQDGTWTWDDIWRSDAPERGLHFAVETDRVGGDSGAWLHLYEAYAIVRHGLPTFPAVLSGAGYVSFGSTLVGDWNGISGSGALGYLEFEVTTSDSDTALNFNAGGTYLDDPDGVEISATQVGSHFYPPIDEDVNADGTIDIFDLALVGIEYGHSDGGIINPRADVDGDNDVDIIDLAMVAIKYGYPYI